MIDCRKEDLFIQTLEISMTVKFQYNFISKTLGVFEEEQKMGMNCFGKDE